MDTDKQLELALTNWDAAHYHALWLIVGLATINTILKCVILYLEWKNRKK